ncbi:hypothetical protein VTO73DRAFT_14880 [Trametes versicolor]
MDAFFTIAPPVPVDEPTADNTLVAHHCIVTLARHRPAHYYPTRLDNAHDTHSFRRATCTFIFTHTLAASASLYD